METVQGNSSLPTKWGIWLKVEGDLRFLSHRQTLDVIQRGATRAGLGLRYTQGFNPHPVLSLVCPRPVGVSSDSDLLVLSLEDQANSPQPAQLCEALNQQAPPGMSFYRSQQLVHKTAPQPKKITYELILAPAEVEPMKLKIEQLLAKETWPVERTAGRDRQRRRKVKTIDLKPMVTDLKIERNLLRFKGEANQSGSPRPSEILGLLGLDPRVDLARLTRNEIEYDLAGPQPNKEI